MRSYRQFFKEISPGFVAWINDQRVRLRHLEELQSRLEHVLRHELADEAACRSFVNSLPDVIKRCDDLDYEHYSDVLAYAHVHFLERYWRAWEFLLTLTEAGALPMHRRHLGVLDVGTGPANCLYAVSDFYEALAAYIAQSGQPQLQWPELRVEAVEGSPAMRHFFHVFSEVCGRRGPFGARYPDFASLDLREERDRWKQDWVKREVEELDISPSYAEHIFQLEARENYASFRYNLYIFSYFLTTPQTVEYCRRAITAILRWLRPGQVVVIVGGTGGHYQAIYGSVEDTARKLGVRRLVECPPTIPCRYNDQHGSVIKRHYLAVWEHIRSVCRNEIYPVGLKGARDLWEPQEPLRGPTEFSLRVLRRGRWPTIHAADHEGQNSASLTAHSSPLAGSPAS